MGPAAAAAACILSPMRRGLGILTKVYQILLSRVLQISDSLRRVALRFADLFAPAKTKRQVKIFG